MARTVDRIYRLLGLLYPWKDVAAAPWSIEHGDQRTRANALEYLDNVLSTPLRHRVLPVLEEMPLEEKVRRGNVFLKTRPRDVENTLLELINDDDQVIAAAAIDLVGQKEMWSLTDDVEHVLAHRDARIGMSSSRPRGRSPAEHSPCSAGANSGSSPYLHLR